MSQGKLTFRATKQKRQGLVKNVDAPSIKNEKVESLKSSDCLSPGTKRKHVSSPESSSPASNPPKTGHSRVKRLEKRIRHTRTTRSTACKTLLDYMNTEKTEPAKEQLKEVAPKLEPVKIREGNSEPQIEPLAPSEPQIEPLAPSETHIEPLAPKEVPADEDPVIEPVKLEDKAIQSDSVPLSAKMLFNKMDKPRVEPAEVKKSYKTTGGRMLAAALSKKRDGVPAHRNEVIRALAAKRELVPTTSKPKGNLPGKEGDTSVRPTPPKLTARQRFAHLTKPTSPKIKPFKAITISSPSKSPAKDAVKASLTLPETYKHLREKFETSDQVVNLLARRQETCTFLKLQKNVQEICRKRFAEKDLGRVVGLYQNAYILAQSKGLSKIKDDRSVRNEYQLTIAFNYVETEAIKKANTTDMFGIHPSLKQQPSRKLDFEEMEMDFNKLSENDQVTLKLAKDKHAFNQRGLISAELLTRARRFSSRLLQYVRDAHKTFLSTLVPVLKIDDAKLVRWHPEFDLNGLELPPAMELPKPPISSRIMSASEMLEFIDSNKAAPPPGMQDAVNKNLQKIIEDKKEKDDKKKDELKDINPDLVARIRAKEAKKIAKHITRNPAKDKELAMVDRLDPIVRCLRVLYVGAGKGSLVFDTVVQEVATNPRIDMSHLVVEQHIRLLLKIVPDFVSMASIRKKEYLKLNRNVDMNKVIDKLDCKITELRG